MQIPIGGFIKQSLIDYVGNISAVIFTVGCNFRCSYCHNPELVYPNLYSKNTNYTWLDILAWLKKNKKLLDAVVITGGEPTLHKNLPELINCIKSLNLKVKLDTNGTNPSMLRILSEKKMVDYIAMDIKTSLNIKKHQQIVGKCFTEVMLQNIKQSIQILKRNNVDFEFRTTLADLILQEDIHSIIDSISGKYYLQYLRLDGITKTKECFLKNYDYSTDNVLVNFR